MLTSMQQAFLHRPRGPGERASSVPAHRDDPPQTTRPAQWDPWAASLPQSRDLSGSRRNGMIPILFLSGATDMTRRAGNILRTSWQWPRLWKQTSDASTPVYRQRLLELV